MERIEQDNKGERMPAKITITEPFGIGFGAIIAEELTETQAMHEAAEIEQYRVNVETSALAICIDVRFGKFLGPKIAGGFKTLQVAAKAVGYRLSGKRLYDRATERGFNLGAHVDTSNEAEGFINGTGCGANDKETDITINFNQNAKTLKDTIKTLINFNSVFNDSTYEGTVLSLTTEDKNELKDIVGEKSVESLIDDGEGVHGHTEWVVYFNYVDNTTIDRDAYFKATGKKLFVVDMWYLKKLADAMAEGADEDVQKQSSDLYHAMVAYQVGTYITLCDGSHRGIIAEPEELASV